MSDPASTVTTPLRRVGLVGIELIDPVTLTRVTQGVRVSAQGLANPPVLSYSGCFVWFKEDGDSWPESISVDVGKLPYEPVAGTIAPPARPVDLDDAPVSARLARVTLCPSVAYPFPDGVLGLRGRLHETADRASPPVAGARIWLRWGSAPDDASGRIDSPVRSTTTESGAFAVFLRPPVALMPEAANGRVSLQLAVLPAGETMPRTKQIEAMDGAMNVVPDPSDLAAVFPLDEMAQEPS
ncbi:hypothetical protein [Caballeronia ptereochthonis]|uniref:Uncharacterized protein n=1 Tax=Caballeronia ptereochthonis TaxID=1777144 RepID=A0A158DYS4_9BURK|nr:hypothetical protein [Caballeronia ptereochthonis]SAK99673.1 hypothetical protein AWB83_06121 [Caballeronia ptereochthonis]